MKKQVLPIAVIVLVLISSPLAISVDQSTGKENMATASDADRHTDQRASRGDTNMFVPPSTTSSSTTTAPTTTSTTAAPKRPKATTAVRAATEALPASQGGNHDVVSIALAQVGKSYRSGATGPNAFDCSGLVHFVFNQAGISVPRLTSDGYFAKYRHVSRDELQPGDLVVYPGHIAIYVGGGQIVSASTPRGGVKHYGMSNPGRIKGYARIS